jgi:uncharacterized protein YjbI with pentapeptide repeats
MHRSIPSLLTFVVFQLSAARADIYEWKYVDPADSSLGKQQSTTLCIGGAGVNAEPSASWADRNLTMAYLIGKDLAGVNAFRAILTNADLSNANLTNASFSRATLIGANFTDANVRGTSFSRDSSGGSGISASQLYATASYKAHDLTGINFTGNDLTGWDVNDADVRGTNFSIYRRPGSGPLLGTGISLPQLYSTANYKAGDLTGASFSGNELSGANFAGQNLTNASFYAAIMTEADFTNAEIRGADLRKANHCGVGCSVGTGVTSTQLYSTASYQNRDLSGVSFYGTNMAGWNLARQNLTNAYFYNASLSGASLNQANLRSAVFQYAILSDVDLADANVQAADFSWFGASGFSPASIITPTQLYSTASYKDHDLAGINLSGNKLNGWNFAGQNISNSYFGLTFTLATLSGADFTAADTRGASGFNVSQPITTNMIRPDGHISGLDLNGGGVLVVRDHHECQLWYCGPAPIPITVDQHLAMGPGGTLRVLFEAAAWDSTISFAPGIPVSRGGSLELLFADGTNVASQIGRTFQLFNWTGVAPTGTFNVFSPYAWDLSNLDTTGEVTLTAIPEPASVMILAVVLAPICFLRGLSNGTIRLTRDSSRYCSRHCAKRCASD